MNGFRKVRRSLILAGVIGMGFAMALDVHAEPDGRIHRGSLPKAIAKLADTDANLNFLDY